MFDVFHFVYLLVVGFSMSPDVIKITQPHQRSRDFLNYFHAL
uniref:Uncharacterized protein n=1 Tax=Salmonella phage vB_SEnST11_KE22 TaxID=3161173 RepID=A0AAU8GI46_9CAUD